MRRRSETRTKPKTRLNKRNKQKEASTAADACFGRLMTALRRREFHQKALRYDSAVTVMRKRSGYEWDYGIQLFLMLAIRVEGGRCSAAGTDDRSSMDVFVFLHAISIFHPKLSIIRVAMIARELDSVMFRKRK